MINHINDGGPAFPVTGCVHPNGNAIVGMTLRDWFAGQALAGMMTRKYSDGWTNREVAGDCYFCALATAPLSVELRSNREVAGDCYFCADAMLAARERKEDDK